MAEQRTAPARDHELFLLFAQLANLLRSGITPAEACVTLAGRNQKQERQNMLRHMATLTAEGVPLSRAMGLYPDVFAPGAVGAVAAGEEGGYLWQSVEVLSQQNQAAWKLRRMYWWVGLVLWSTIFSFPLVWVAMAGTDAAIATINTGANGFQELFRGMGKALVGWPGIVTAVLVVGYFFGRAWSWRTSSRLLRHRMAARAPIVGKRTQGENLAALSYHLGQLSRAGISPWRAWQLSCVAVPNEAYAEELSRLGQGLGEGTRLSALLYQAKLFPQEYVPLVETGELTGTTPQALDQAMELGRGDAKQAETILKIKAAVWGVLIVLGSTAIVYIIFLRGYFDSAFRHVLAE